jgi:uncharacterized protein YjbI with pentapeptide repeats
MARISAAPLLPMPIFQERIFATPVTLEQARSAKGWLLARWSPEILNALGLPENHNDNVRAKLFRGHALAGAHLNDLDLSRAVLADAILDNATFYRRQP